MEDSGWKRDVLRDHLWGAHEGYGREASGPQYPDNGRDSGVAQSERDNGAGGT